MKNKIFTGPSFLLIMLLSSCQAVSFKSPAGYNLKEPQITTLKESLHEISGISFLNTNDDTLYAINDEDGKLFYFTLQNKKPSTVKFGKPGDYEDLAIVENTVIVLKSDGDLHAFPVQSVLNEKIDSPAITKGAIPKNEYEGLFADSTGKLYILCKNCQGDKPSLAIKVYSLLKNSNGTYTSDSILHIDVTAIKNLLKEDKLSFHPSAFAIHPITKEWYILSSVNKILVIADKDFKVKEAYRLKPNLFRQPEGIAFDRAGNMYVSNEGRDEDADILFFKYNKPVQ